METTKDRSPFVKGLKSVASVHLHGLVGIVIVIALFFAAAKYISYSGHTLTDMRGFEVVAEVSDGTERHLVPAAVSADGAATRYYLVDGETGEELVVDLSRWEVAGHAWTSPVTGITPVATDDSGIAFDLPAHDSHYYTYTFAGSWDLPPAGREVLFEKFGTCSLARAEIDYTLAKELEALTFFFHQYDDEERIDQRSWAMPHQKGSNTFAVEALDIHSQATSFRVYLRFVNRTQNRITLESLRLINMHGYSLLVTGVENNFKRLSFDLNLSEVPAYPGYVGFRKDADLRGRGDYQNLYFFVSAETDELDKALLSFLAIKIHLDGVLVWSMPVSEISNPTFVAQRLDLSDKKELGQISFRIGYHLPAPLEQSEIMNHSVHIAIEYLDIRD